MSTILNQYLHVEAPMQVTLADDAPAYEFEGYASVFNNVNAYGFAIGDGAFTKTLKENPNPPLLWNHLVYSETPIGVITSAEQDKRGLKIVGKLVEEIERARQVYALMKAGAVRGLSIGFRVLKSVYDQAKSLETITELQLSEVSVCTFPADSKAKVGRVLTAIHTLSVSEGVSHRADLEVALANLSALLRGEQPAHATVPESEPHDVAALRSLLNDIKTEQRSILR